MMAAMASGEVMAATAPMKSILKMPWHTARWVDSTPLARLVAPEVNRISAGSSALSCGDTKPS
jgi:hypothetical protein